MPATKIIIEGNPVPQPRARVTRWSTYDPAHEAKTYIRWILREQWEGKDVIASPVEVFFKFFMPIPKSTSKKNRALMISGEIIHQKKPDRNNMEKLYEDCMSGIVFADDRQSWNGGSRKMYSEHPRTEITLKY